MLCHQLIMIVNKNLHLPDFPDHFPDLKLSGWTEYTTVFPPLMFYYSKYSSCQGLQQRNISPSVNLDMFLFCTV